jgi:hypothetical protein
MSDSIVPQSIREYWTYQDIDDAFASGRVVSGPLVRLRVKNITARSLEDIERTYGPKSLFFAIPIPAYFHNIAAKHKKELRPTRAERIEEAWDIWECNRANTTVPNNHHVDIVVALRKAAK